MKTIDQALGAKSFKQDSGALSSARAEHFSGSGFVGEQIAVEAAFVEKAGGMYVVRQGNNGKELSRWKSKKDADNERDRLHRKNKPSGTNRGKSAKKRADDREMS